MRLILLLTVLACLLLSLTAAAQAPPQNTITLPAADGISLAADFHPATNPSAPALILLHMLNSNRGAYEALIPDLQAAGYALLNVDMRGHGDSGGTRDWDMAIKDLTEDWLGWLKSAHYIGADGLALIGGSIGANVALISCARIDVCRGAIALSPGLDYRGVKPEAALVDGLANHSALLAAAQGDKYSADSVRRMFSKATGDVTARLYRGRAHGTRLFDSDYDSVSRLILHWLAEHLPVKSSLEVAAAEDSSFVSLCGIDDLKWGKRGSILCSSVPVDKKPITKDHCLYEYLLDQDGDGCVCETNSKKDDDNVYCGEEQQ